LGERSGYGTLPNCFARLFDVYDYLSQHGRIFPGGTCPSVGLAGYLLGGGYGWYSRAFGLGIDNLVEVDVVRF
jgi:FAD/FMN-containing dehydrogenase